MTNEEVIKELDSLGFVDLTKGLLRRRIDAFCYVVEERGEVPMIFFMSSTFHIWLFKFENGSFYHRDPLFAWEWESIQSELDIPSMIALYS